MHRIGRELFWLSLLACVGPSEPSQDSGVTPPPGPNACQGVAIAAGASIQAAVNAAGSGATFCASSGTYAKQRITPKAGQSFVCTPRRTCILDGQGIDYAFLGPNADVTVQGFVIRGYAPALSNAAIWGYNGARWRILDNEITGNKPGAGTGVWTGWLIRGNSIHHNGQLGITGQADLQGATIDSNEVAYNNQGRVTDPDCCAGGIKVVRAYNMTMTGNFVHQNDGHGMWCDFCRGATRYLGNRVEDNSFVGIYHEASDHALISGNTVLRNGAANRGGIWVDNSVGVEVAGNTVDGATSGILGRQVSRSDTPRQLVNLWVHDNIVRLDSAEYSGVVQHVGDDSYFTSKSNRFDGNQWTLPGATALAFRWNDTSLTWSQWRAAGHDAKGTAP